MSGVAIYMEGGGDSKDTKAALRVGMDGLLGTLKQSARDRKLLWKLVCCGTRNRAFRAFRNALRNGDDSVVVLLVDAEGPVKATARDHLQTRDQWDLTDIDDNAVHLMVQVMETWIAADPNALAGYYGQGFNAGALPTRRNLEEEPKASVERSLERATAGTKKGGYHKIRHASELLQRIDAETVKTRCHHCQRVFDELGRLIDEA